MDHKNVAAEIVSLTNELANARAAELNRCHEVKVLRATVDRLLLENDELRSRLRVSGGGYPPVDGVVPGPRIQPKGM